MAKQQTRTVGMGTANLMGVAVSWCPVVSMVSDVLSAGGGILSAKTNTLSRKICGKPTCSAHKGASRFLVG